MEKSTNPIINSVPAAGVYISKDNATPPPNYSTIAELADSLQTFGPLIAEGSFGPKSYEGPAKTAFEIDNHTIFGWAPGTVRKTCQVSIMILGVDQNVYYKVAELDTHHQNALSKRYSVSKVDNRTYGSSFNTFLQKIHTVHPVFQRGVESQPLPRGSGEQTEIIDCTETFVSNAQLNPLTEKQTGALKIFMAMTPEQVLDEGSNEALCREIGQQIFDAAAQESGDNSQIDPYLEPSISDGPFEVLFKQMALQDEATLSLETLKGKRALKAVVYQTQLQNKAIGDCIEKAWDGVGNSEWKWRA